MVQISHNNYVNSRMFLVLSVCLLGSILHEIPYCRIINSKNEDVDNSSDCDTAELHQNKMVVTVAAVT